MREPSEVLHDLVNRLEAYNQLAIHLGVPENAPEDVKELIVDAKKEHRKVLGLLAEMRETIGMLVRPTSYEAWMSRLRDGRINMVRVSQGPAHENVTVFMGGAHCGSLTVGAGVGREIAVRLLGPTAVSFGFDDAPEVRDYTAGPL